MVHPRLGDDITAVRLQKRHGKLLIALRQAQSLELVEMADVRLLIEESAAFGV
jgi:hypothetical protein